MKCPNCGKSLWFLKSYCAFCKTALTEEGKRLLKLLEHEHQMKLERRRASKSAVMAHGHGGQPGLVTSWEAVAHGQSPAPEDTIKKATLFYFKVQGEEKGPYTIRQLTSMWYGGQITADALYRTDTSSEWVPLISRFD